MRLAMAQMKMSLSIPDNFKKSMNFIEQARNNDLLFFPEIQVTPFFPQYKVNDLKNALGYMREDFSLNLNNKNIQQLRNKCQEYDLCLSPNFYIHENGKNYDMSLFYDNHGTLLGTSKMVHVVSTPQFYELDYYTPSEEGFHVYDTEYGKIGVVICFDRHLPESIRTCAVQGAELIIIPTANLKSEPLDMFQQELQVQAYQNNIFIAMCNRTGKEGNIEFAGESLVVDSDGNVVFHADDTEQLIQVEIDLHRCQLSRKTRPYITLRRPDMYL